MTNPLSPYGEDLQTRQEADFNTEEIEMFTKEIATNFDDSKF
jgi:hypothetical protein